MRLTIGNIVFERVGEELHKTEWYQYNPSFNPNVKDLGDIVAVCHDNTACIADYLIHADMSKHEITNDIYKFIAHRAHIIREGLQNNLIPHHHLDFGGIFDLVDWHFVLDCILGGIL